jgi:hypothetical protein
MSDKNLLPKKGLNKKIVEKLRDELSYNQYVNLSKALEINSNSFARLENGNRAFQPEEVELLYRHLVKILGYRDWLHPDTFFIDYEMEQYVTLSQVRQLTESYKSQE